MVLFISMNTILVSAALILASYLLGSVPFAVVISRIMGLRDPRKFGSRNPGATNVLRSGNRPAAALTLLGDLGKGWIAVGLAQYVAGIQHLPASVVALCGFAAFIGHVLPVFLRFKGGKGVATALGVLLGINVWLGVATAATWVIIAWAFRYSSLAAIVACIFAPLYYILGSNVVWRGESSVVVMLVAISAVLLYRHQTNISRLMQGKEPRIGQSGSTPGHKRAAGRTRR